jgi:hypothetical protein
MLIKQTMQYMIIGYGGSISAIIGLKIVEKRENTLQIPNTYELTMDGK